MTFAEAIDWISKQEKCNWSEAIRQIRTALADKEITGLCWEDQRSGMTAVLDSRPDYPPTDREFWQGEASVPDDEGRVFDRWTNRWRTLLVPKENIFQIWSETSAASAGSERSGPTAKAKGRGRPGAEIEIHQAIDRLAEGGHDVKGMLRKKLVTLVDEKCEKRRKPRTIMTYISSWLEKHRTDA
jgi:hypothetical protein